MDPTRAPDAGPDPHTLAFTASALRLRLITPEQAQEVTGLYGQLQQMGLATPISEVFVKKGYLETQQLVAVETALGADSQHAIPGYEILDKIGEGGMGAIFRARQLSMDRVVAIKLLLPGNSADAAWRERFLREARSVAKLSHPNVVAGIDVGEAAGVWYFVMEYLDGESLQQRLRSAPLDWNESLRVIRQIALALEHAHRHGIVHRDVKPSNIMLLTDGTAKLADLGLARSPGTPEATLTQSGMVIGTPAYVSPEQATGERTLDIRSDLFSLGLTWYECLVGERAFPGANPLSVMTAVLTRDLSCEKLASVRIPADGVAILRKLTRRDPGERFSTPTELLLDIDAVLAERTPQAMKGVRTTVAALPRKHANAWAWLFAAVFAVIAGGGYLWQTRLGPAESEDDPVAPIPARVLPEPAPAPAAGVAAPPGAIDLLAAIATAQSEVGEGAAVHAEFEPESGIYSIDFSIGQRTKNVEIDAGTRKMTALQDEGDDHSADVAAAKIDLPTAVRVAVATVPGTPSEAKLLRRFGLTIIEVAILVGTDPIPQRVFIDAVSGRPVPPQTASGR
jgi:serine/threonine-protein kinase